MPKLPKFFKVSPFGLFYFLSLFGILGSTLYLTEVISFTPSQEIFVVDVEESGLSLTDPTESNTYAPGQEVTVSIKAEDYGQKNLKAELFTLKVSDSTSKDKVCRWPGGYKMIKNNIPLDSKGIGKHTFSIKDEGEFYVLVNIRGDKNQAMCAGAFSWNDMSCGFSYPKCDNGSLKVNISNSNVTSANLGPYNWSPYANAQDTDNYNLDSFSSHPNFWSYTKDGIDYRWTAKRFKAVPNSESLNYDNMWWWSGGPQSAYDRTDLRYVIFQKYKGDNALDYHEWELWRDPSNGKDAVLYDFGGTSNKTTVVPASSKNNCEKSSFGVNWPNITNKSTAITPMSLKLKDGCTDTWDGDKGNYISNEIVSYYDSTSNERNSFCDTFLSSSISTSANNICKSSPKVSLVFQKYVGGPNNKLIHGCEATIYTWGYSKAEAQSWFRNGEVRWSFYQSASADGSYHRPDESSFWYPLCNTALNNKANWIYTGEYKLNSEVYKDLGN